MKTEPNLTHHNLTTTTDERKTYFFQLPIFLKESVLVFSGVEPRPYVPFPFKVIDRCFGDELVWRNLLSSEASPCLAWTLQAQIKLDTNC